MARAWDTLAREHGQLNVARKAPTLSSRRDKAAMLPRSRPYGLGSFTGGSGRPSLPAGRPAFRSAIRGQQLARPARAWGERTRKDSIGDGPRSISRGYIAPTARTSSATTATRRGASPPRRRPAVSLT